jgi:hypothetical protein
LTSTSKIPPQLGQARAQAGEGGVELIQAFGFHGAFWRAKSRIIGSRAAAP